MSCALCQLNKPLRRSHIAPEFMYKPMYDSNHRFRAFSREVSETPQIHQKGLREELLCDDCEQLLANNYENYAAASFYRPAVEAMKQPPPGFTLPGFDYHRFKLFLLSLLWRFGNATHGGGVSPCKLRPTFGETKKNALAGQPRRLAGISVLDNRPDAEREILRGFHCGRVLNQSRRGFSLGLCTFGLFLQLFRCQSQSTANPPPIFPTARRAVRNRR